MLVYREGTGHVENSGKIIKQFGSKDGLHWSAPELLFDCPGVDDRDPSLSMFRDGTVALCFFQYVEGNCLKSPKMYSNYFSYSKDLGKTFSKPEMVDEKAELDGKDFKIVNRSWVNKHGDMLYGYQCSSPVIKEKSKLLLPAYGGESLVMDSVSKKYISNKSRLVFYESKNYGKKWEKRIINPLMDTLSYLQEPSVIKLKDGKMLMHFRTSEEVNRPGGKGRMKQSVSNDGGNTWQDYTTFDFIGQAPFLFEMENGTLISTFRLLEDGRQKSALIYSRDYGMTWSKPVIYYDSKGECGYPSIVELERNKIMIVFYSNLGKGIQGIIYNVKIPQKAS